MDIILIIDLGFISWWHSKLMMFAINWRAGWQTSLEYGEWSAVDLHFKPYDGWRVLEDVRRLHGFIPYPIDDSSVLRSSGS